MGGMTGGMGGMTGGMGGMTGGMGGMGGGMVGMPGSKKKSSTDGEKKGDKKKRSVGNKKKRDQQILQPRPLNLIRRKDQLLRDLLKRREAPRRDVILINLEYFM